MRIKTFFSFDFNPKTLLFCLKKNICFILFSFFFYFFLEIKCINKKKIYDKSFDCVCNFLVGSEHDVFVLLFAHQWFKMSHQWFKMSHQQCLIHVCKKTFPVFHFENIILMKKIIIFLLEKIILFLFGVLFLFEK